MLSGECESRYWNRALMGTFDEAWKRKEGRWVLEQLTPFNFRSPEGVLVNVVVLSAYEAAPVSAFTDEAWKEREKEKGG